MAVAAPVRAARLAPAAPVAARPRPRTGPATPFGGGLQAKLALGPPSDVFERQADGAAAHVIGGREGAPRLSALPGRGWPGTPALAQRACTACALSEEETRPRIQRQCACGASAGAPCTCPHEREDEEAHPELRVDRAASRAAAGNDAAIRAVEQVVSLPGQPLPDAVRQEMEQGFGRDFAAVRIHDSPRAAASAEGIGAHAYTVGNHIAFNRGQFRPDTEGGRRLLAHELAHTVQQAGAPPAGPAAASRVSRPTDRHEAEAQAAAGAVLTGAPMPALSPGAAPISRYSLSEFGEDIVDLGEAVADGVVDTAEGVADAASAAWDTATDIAAAIGGAFSLDGTTMVITVPAFDPCPALAFDFQLSDIGLDPTLYFPIVAGALSVGALSVVGVLGITVNLDPGLGFHLEGCSIGPTEIRIDPLGAEITVRGGGAITAAAMVSLGAALALNATAAGVLAIPATPPIVLVVPVVGLNLGGAMAFMLQGGGTLDHRFDATLGLGGLSSRTDTSADIGFKVDLAGALLGGVDVLGLNLCTVAWPMGQVHEELAARLTLTSYVSAGLGGFDFDLDADIEPLEANPLDDLGFAFDQSQLQDDCPLCDFFTDNGLMPGQNGYNWAALEPGLPRLAGPLRGVYQRDPRLASGALCRGTCGVDCPPDPSCTEPYDRVVCQNTGDSHVWHTYVGYATCGTHQGCRDHDACYDFAATMPIWGFGGYMIGPMYRACDLEAMCGYSFQQGVTWAMGGGPYDGRLAYADYAYSTPGCLGPCPQNVAPEGEAEVMQTCLEDRELWPGLDVGDSWGVDFGSTRLFQGFVEVPWIVGVHYGIDASARADADASAELGPVNLENACLIYDPATMTYSGTADLVLYLNGRASASLTGRLDGWLSDFLCILRAVNLGGWLNAGVTVQLPSDLRFGVELYCADGDLEVQPSLELNVCLDAFAELRAGFDISLLGFTIHKDEWQLAGVQLDACWMLEFPLDAFSVGEMPGIEMISTALDVFSVLADLFDEAPPRAIDRRPARNPIPGSGLLFPCVTDDDGDEEDPDADCPQRATGADGDRLLTVAERAPTYGPVTTLSVPGGDSAGIASWMEAPYLTRSHPPGAPTNDTVQRGIYRRVGLPTNSCVGAGYKQSQVYVKGHLLNEGLGGPAEERNLYPITGQANANHKNQVEQRGLRVVPRVNTGNELIYYKVSVQNVSALSEIMTSAGNPTGLFELSATFHCEVADYQYCNDDTLRRNAVQTVDVRSEFVFHPSGGRAFDTIMRPCSR